MNEHMIKTLERSTALMKKVAVFLVESENKYGKEDFRHIFIARPATSIAIQVLTIKQYESTIYRQEWWISLNIGTDEVKELGELHQLFLKKSQFLDFVSLVETEFRNLVRKLFPTSCNGGKASFESIYKKVLSEFDLTNFIELFTLMVLIRNTVHNNGFYFPTNNVENKTVTFKYKSFLFEYGKAMEFIHPEFLVEIEEEVFECFFEILELQVIKEA